MPHQVEQLNMAQLEWLLENQTISMTASEDTNASLLRVNHSAKVSASSPGCSLQDLSPPQQNEFAMRARF